MRTKSVLLFFLWFITLYNVWAGPASSTSLGATTLNIKSGSVKNILRNSSGSNSAIHIGSAQNSHVQSADIKLKLGRVSNVIENASNSTAITNVGNIKDVKGGRVRLDVDVNAVTTKIRSGNNNQAFTTVGTLYGNTVDGRAEIDVHADEVSNVIQGGNNNYAEVSIGDDPVTKREAPKSKGVFQVVCPRPCDESFEKRYNELVLDIDKTSKLYPSAQEKWLWKNAARLIDAGPDSLLQLNCTTELGCNFLAAMAITLTFADSGKSAAAKIIIKKFMMKKKLKQAKKKKHKKRINTCPTGGKKKGNQPICFKMYPSTVKKPGYYDTYVQLALATQHPDEMEKKADGSFGAKPGYNIRHVLAWAKLKDYYVTNLRGKTTNQVAKLVNPVLVRNNITPIKIPVKMAGAKKQVSNKTINKKLKELFKHINKEPSNLWPGTAKGNMDGNNDAKVKNDYSPDRNIDKHRYQVIEKMNNKFKLRNDDEIWEWQPPKLGKNWKEHWQKMQLKNNKKP